MNIENKVFNAQPITFVTQEQAEYIATIAAEKVLARIQAKDDLPEYLTREQVLAKLNISRDIYIKMLNRGWLTDANAQGRKNKIEKKSFMATQDRVNQIRRRTGRKTIQSKDIF